MQTKVIDDRRILVVGDDRQEALTFCIEHFLQCAKEAIADHDAFYVALSGGSTPKAIYELLASDEHFDEINWAKAQVFWSDERAVPPEHPDSNYAMALSAGLGKLTLPTKNIHRMVAENDIEKNALEYEKTIAKVMGNAPFDLVMLGMGDDGHTASLFPGTKGLEEKERKVIANKVPQKKCTRMTFTFPFINQAHNAAIYVMGDSKKEMVNKVLSEAMPTFPSGHVGTAEKPALWITDSEAASLVKKASVS